MRIAVDFKSVSLRPGIGAFQARMFAEIARSGQNRHKFLLFGPRAALSGFRDEPSFETLPIDIPSGLGRLRLPFYDQVQLPLAMRQHEVDLLFCPYVDAPLLTPMPVVLTAHDLVLLRFPQLYSSHARFYFNSLLRAHLRKGCQICTVSEFSRRDLIATLGVEPERIHLLPYTIPKVFLSASARDGCGLLARLGIRSQFILYTGGSDPRKNLDRLLYAIDRINTAGPRKYLLVVTGEEAKFSAYRQTLKSNGLAGKVVFTGVLTEQELATLYCGADLLIYPSLWEGYGLPVLEAIATGTPIAASNSSSIPEVGQDAAVYFDPLNADDMVNVTRRALYDQGLRAELRCAAERIRAEVALRRPAEAILSLFDTIASGRADMRRTCVGHTEARSRAGGWNIF